MWYSFQSFIPNNILIIFLFYVDLKYRIILQSINLFKNVKILYCCENYKIIIDKFSTYNPITKRTYSTNPNSITNSLNPILYLFKTYDSMFLSHRCSLVNKVVVCETKGIEFDTSSPSIIIKKYPRRLHASIRPNMKT